ncbi:Tn3 family transposase [Nonomuraea sp. NPDC049152]|uniref:Tn3 family transposase n=1 Tax=Nonomuraea sp. NPDC049152 TaxID=3154350 RepID=UPI0033FB398D
MRVLLYRQNRQRLTEETIRDEAASLPTNSVICWTTEYYSKAIAALRAQGRDVPDELLSFITPGHSENINFFGMIDVDIEAEPSKLDGGWRPLRPTQVTESGTSFILNPGLPRGRKRRAGDFGERRGHQPLRTRPRSGSVKARPPHRVHSENGNGALAPTPNST